jgi:hypothetical protein
MNDALSRRAFCITLAEALGVAATGLCWADVVAAGQEAHAAGQAPGVEAARFFTVEDAADVEAIADLILPGGSTPGAREAGVVHFIDRVLATVLSRLANDFRTQLAAFQGACHERNPDLASFALLPRDRRIEFLRSVVQTPFFDRMRLLTLLGMFTSPAYGGNAGGIGWKLIGFEDRHAFAPPFGYYDRDYPGFTIDPPGHA